VGVVEVERVRLRPVRERREEGAGAAPATDHGRVSGRPIVSHRGRAS
jgi:hypothetical protein